MLRLYRYRTADVGTGCHAHSDLGLLTLSPAPTAPGLLAYDSETLQWYEAEAYPPMAPDEISFFCGEQLAVLSGGAVRAPLHRVPPPPAGEHAAPRYSMPFFARASPKRSSFRLDQPAA